MKNQTTLLKKVTSDLNIFTLGFVITCLFLQSCSTQYEFLESEKMFKENHYENDKPFRMRQGNIQAPLFSEKGQFNMNFDFVHGLGMSTAYAVTNKMYIQAGINRLKSSSSTSGEERMKVKEINLKPGYSDVYDTIVRSPLIDYNLTLDLRDVTYYVAVGKYMTFGNHGRFEYCGGLTYGQAQNNYMYEFFYDIRLLRRYSFEESRKYLQYYIQSDFGYVTRKTEGAILLRASCLNFFDRNFKMDYQADEYKMENNQLVLQPALKFGFGKTLRTYIQCGWNVTFDNSQLKWFSTNVQAGIIIRINDKTINKI